MNKATRMLVMTGMAIVAGATFSAGPAAAATASPAPTAATSAADTAGRPEHSRIVGYFRTPFECHRVGNIGEWRNRWDDHDCIPIRAGFHRLRWALRVSWDHHGFPGHGGPGFPWHGGPGFPGHGGPGFPGHDGPGFPGHDGPGFPGHDGPGPWNHR